MRKAGQWILSLVLVAGVLVTGGVHAASYALMDLTVFAIFLLLLIQQTRRGKIVLPFPPVLWLLVFLLIIQLIPLPVSVIRWISPHRWGNLPLDVSEASNLWIPLSTYPHATWVGSFKMLAYLAAFSLGAFLFDSRKRGLSLISALAGLGLMEALLGIIFYVGGWQELFPWSSEYRTERARGSYINPNHFASVLSMTSPFLFGWIYYLYQKSRHRLAVGGPVELEGRRPSKAGQIPFFAFLLVMMFIALAVSGSRMGMFSAISSFLLLLLLTQLKGRQTAFLMGSFVVLGAVLAYLFWIGLDPIVARFETLLETGYLRSGVRISVWKDELRLFQDYKWLGAGLGTFGIIFKGSQTTNLEYWFDQGHNDYLQFAAELGLVGFLLLFVPIFHLLVRMVRSFLNDQSRYRASVTLGCIGGASAMLVHSFADFNLQIPANAMIFAVILGIGYKACCLERKAEANLE